MSALARRESVGASADEHAALLDRGPRRRVQWYDALLGAALIAVVVLAATTVGASGSSAPIIRTATVARGVVQSSVQATGNVAPAGTYSVGFATGGTVSEIDVSPGQQVTKGQVLAKLDSSQALQQLAAAEQNTSAAQARLQELQQVLTPAEQNQLNVAAQQAQSAVDTANQNLANAQQKLTADQAAHASASQLAQDQQAVDQAQNQLTQAQNQQQTTLASNAVKAEPPQQADVAADQASIISAQSSQATAQKALDETVLVAPSNGVITAVNGSVGQTVSGGGNSAVTASSASSTSGSSGSSGGSGGAGGGSGGAGGATGGTGAGAGAATGGASSSNTSGSTASSSGSSSSAFITLVDVSSLDVNVGFSESDATKVQPGQPATVTFDALPGTTLPGVVTAVATTSTVVSNVVTYAVTVQLTQTAADVKPGMTASVTVITGEADNALHVPSAAVRGSGANATVMVLQGKRRVTTPVTTGMVGDTDTVILTGVKVGDRVVTSVSTPGSSNTSGTGISGLTNRFGGGGLGGGGLGGAGRGFGGGGFGGRGG